MNGSEFQSLWIAIAELKMRVAKLEEEQGELPEQPIDDYEYVWGGELD